MKDQRQHVRKEIVASALIANPSGNDWKPVTLLDISVGGAAFSTSERVIVDTTRLVNITLPNEVKPIPLSAKIVNRSPMGSAFRVGIKFFNADPIAIEQIRHYIEAAPADELQQASEQSANNAK
ncbi:MAG TPA: PilZ domain-containing protein [Burkholderiaceae bacterium]|jgi:c-di-GMP-binding flagellar brake protein YcgR